MSEIFVTEKWFHFIHNWWIFMSKLPSNFEPVLNPFIQKVLQSSLKVLNFKPPNQPNSLDAKYLWMESGQFMPKIGGYCNHIISKHSSNLEPVLIPFHSEIASEFFNFRPSNQPFKIGMKNLWKKSMQFCSKTIGYCTQIMSNNSSNFKQILTAFHPESGLKLSQGP